MGMGGAILGGLLAGAGQGLQQDIMSRRQTALENLRAQREGANITLKAEADDRRAAATENARYNHDLALEGAKTLGDIKREGAKTTGKVTEIKTQGEVDASLQAKKDAAEYQRDTAVQKLRNSGSQADLRLSREIAGTEVETTYTNSKGNLVIVAKGGRVITTNIRGEAPKGADAGGDLSGLRGGGGTPPPAAAASPAPVAARPLLDAAKPKPPATQPMDRGEYDQRMTKALTLAQGGDPRFKGMSASQIKAKVDDALINAGYAPPR
jgi:hypothetical protein